MTNRKRQTCANCSANAATGIRSLGQGVRRVFLLVGLLAGGGAVMGDFVKAEGPSERAPAKAVEREYSPRTETAPDPVATIPLQENDGKEKEKTLVPLGTESKRSTSPSRSVRTRLEPTQFGSWILEASSVLASQSGNTYGPENVTADAPEANPMAMAWVEGVPGDGIGEWVQFNFGEKDDGLTISTVTIANGYQKSRDTFKKNNRIRSMKISHEGGEETVTLADGDYPQKVQLRKPTRTNWIRFTIESIYPGSRYDDTAISDIRLDIENFNYYPPLEGKKFVSPDGQLTAWVIPLKGEKSVLPENLVQIWDERVKPGGMPLAVGARDHTSDSGMNGRGVSAAAWTPDSRFFVYTTFSSGGHSPWHATGFFFDRQSGRVLCLDDYGIVVVNTKLSTATPDIIEVIAQREKGDLEGTRIRPSLSELLSR